MVHSSGLGASHLSVAALCSPAPRRQDRAGGRPSARFPHAANCGRVCEACVAWHRRRRRCSAVVCERFGELGERIGTYRHRRFSASAYVLTALCSRRLCSLWPAFCLGCVFQGSASCRMRARDGFICFCWISPIAASASGRAISRSASSDKSASLAPVDEVFGQSNQHLACSCVRVCACCSSGRVLFPRLSNCSRNLRLLLFSASCFRASSAASRASSLVEGRNATQKGGSARASSSAVF